MPTQHHTSFHHPRILWNYIFPWLHFPKGTKLKKKNKKLIACEWDKEKKSFDIKWLTLLLAYIENYWLVCSGDFDYKCDIRKTQEQSINNEFLFQKKKEEDFECFGCKRVT